MRTKEYQAAVDSFDKALEMAKVQGDKAAESAIRKAIEDVNKKIVQSIKEGENEEQQGQEVDGAEEQEVKGDQPATTQEAEEIGTGK